MFCTDWNLHETQTDVPTSCATCEQPIPAGLAHYRCVKRRPEVVPQPSGYPVRFHGFTRLCTRCVAAALQIDAETLAARADNADAERHARGS